MANMSSQRLRDRELFNWLILQEECAKHRQGCVRVCSHCALNSTSPAQRDMVFLQLKELVRNGNPTLDSIDELERLQDLVRAFQRSRGGKTDV